MIRAKIAACASKNSADLEGKAMHFTPNGRCGSGKRPIGLDGSQPARVAWLPHLLANFWVFDGKDTKGLATLLIVSASAYLPKMAYTK
jgi:hypothetical protein